jgi:CheY-like chemotaxis protein
MKVLIVEDNRAVRQMLRMMLGDLAEHWYECGDGDEVLDCYRACQPDWVLMDISMPRLDGIEATRLLKAASPTARVVIVTSYNDAALRAAAEAAGACGYVLKENLLELRRLLRPAAAG